jgi:hypothetical protein
MKVEAHREGVEAVAAAPVAGVDRRQAGGGCSWRAPCEEKGCGEKNLGRWRLAPFNGGGGGRSSGEGPVWGRRHVAEEDVGGGGWRGARATLSAGSGARSRETGVAGALTGGPGALCRILNRFKPSKSMQTRSNLF